MGAIKRIAQEATDNVVRWLESLSRKTGYSTEELQQTVGPKAEKLMQQAPQMFDIYEDKDLFEIIREASEGYSDIGLMKTPDFRTSAAKINTNDPTVKQMTDERIAPFIESLQMGLPLEAKSGMPYLSYTTPGKDIIQVVGHEGRGRTRALEATGEPYQLVRMIPAGKEKLVSEMNPESKIYTEVSPMQLEGEGGKEVGALGQLLKILGIAGVVTPGALSSLGGEDGS